MNYHNHDDVWISSLLYYFSAFFSVSVLIEKIYQTLKTVFDHVLKPLEIRQKYSAARCISTVFSLFGDVVKDGLSCLKNDFSTSSHYGDKKRRRMEN